MTMAIFPIIVHFSTQRVRSMHDVACEFACAIKAGFHYRRSRSRNRRRSRKRTYDQVKIENRSRNRSRKNRNLSISYDSVYDSVAYDQVKTRLSESEAEAEEQTNHKARNPTL